MNYTRGMKSLLALIQAEPVALVAVVQTTLAAAVLFGLPLSEAQLAGVVVAVGAWLGFFTRSKVEVSAG